MPTGFMRKAGSNWNCAQQTERIWRILQKIAKRIGESPRELSRQEVNALVERIMVERSGADLAHLSSSETRDILPAGRLLARHVWNVMPFEDTVVIVEVEGRELPEETVEEMDVDPNGAYSLALSDFTAATHRVFRSKPARALEGDPLLRDLIIEWIRERDRAEAPDAEP